MSKTCAISLMVVVATNSTLAEKGIDSLETRYLENHQLL